MKERIALSKAVAIGEDLQATSFRPNYMYLLEDGVLVYFDPVNIPSQRVLYPESGATEDTGIVIMPKDVADNFKAALAAVLELTKARMENPFVKPVKEEEPVTPAEEVPPIKGAETPKAEEAVTRGG